MPGARRQAAVKVRIGVISGSADHVDGPLPRTRPVYPQFFIGPYSLPSQGSRGVGPWGNSGVASCERVGSPTTPTTTPTRHLTKPFFPWFPSLHKIACKQPRGRCLSDEPGWPATGSACAPFSFFSSDDTVLARRNRRVFKYRIIGRPFCALTQQNRSLQRQRTGNRTMDEGNKCR